MADAIPERLSTALADRYRLDRKLGEGGMATVYLAEDLKHRRSVAVKVLRPELSAILGAERFLKEIEVTANLQHPNVLPLYDSGEADTFLFYVMPFIEGESLRDRLTRERQLGVEDTVALASALAGALGFAHSRGVIHRDIKPENILLQAGQPLVADFGIALAVSAAGGTRITETGLSLGTPHYMSPEQATADQPLDARSDIYSLGAVVYEMLVGEPPHVGHSVQAILSKVLSETPIPVATRRSSVPRNIDLAVGKALSKVPADRFSTAARFVEALEDSAFTTTTAAQAAPRAGLGRFLWPAGTVVALLLAVLGWLRDPSTTDPVIRTQITLPENLRMAVGARGGGDYALDLSRDGTMLVFVGDENGELQLYLRRLDTFGETPLPDTEGAHQPFFSPDGDWIGFFTRNELRRVPVTGGAPITVTRLPLGRSAGGSWGTDGTILYAAGESLFRIPVAGGPAVEYPVPDTLRQATGRDDQAPVVGGVPLWPHFLPDGKHALVTLPSGTAVLDLDTGEYRHLMSGGQARYLTSGHLIFNGGQERARLVPFDLNRLELTGPTIPAVDNVFRGPGGGALNLAVSNNGTLVYVRGGFDRSLLLVDRNGRETPLAFEPRGYRFPRMSRDRRWLAVTVDPRPSDLWVLDLERGTATPQPTDAHDGWGVWSPDARRVAFQGGNPSLRVRDFPFATAPIPVTHHPGIFPTDWTLDDRLLATRNEGAGAGGTGHDVAVVTVADGTVQALVATPAAEFDPRLSPDGSWVAFVSDQSGINEIYVMSYPSPAEHHLVSQGGGTDPAWSEDGSELFYRSGNAIMGVAVTTSPTFRVTGPPVQLFERPYDFNQEGNWAVGPNGQFLMIRGDPTTSRQFQVVVNWFQELGGTLR